MASVRPIINYFRPLLQILGLLVVSCVAAGIVFVLNPPPPATAGIAELTLSQAEPLNPLWVDARTQREWTAGHTPGAVWVGLEAYNDGLTELASIWRPGRPIVVYCDASCHSSKEVAAKLQKSLGASASIYVLKGGYHDPRR